MKIRLQKIISSHIKVIKTLQRDAGTLQKMVNQIATSLAQKGKVLVCGNGGSAADAQHMAAELVGKFKKKRGALAAIALTVDTSIITSVGNDYSFSDIFSRQIEALAKKGDTLVLVSTSGNSQNLLKAARRAKRLNIKTIGILGKGGGKLKKLVNTSLVVKSNETPRIQEAHSLILHTLCELIEERFADS